MTERTQRERSLHAAHGGVHFTQLSHTRDINEFVRGLPETQKDSLFEVMQALHDNGHIRIENDGEFTNPFNEIHPDTHNS